MFTIFPRAAFFLSIMVWPAFAAAQTQAVVNVQGKEYTIETEVADNPVTRSQGLMHRTHLDRNQGMLFVFENARVVHMWMKDTLLPLDMLFIEDSGRIAHIVRNTTPESTEVISSGTPVKYVLEINGGLADQWGAKPGDTVRLTP